MLKTSFYIHKYFGIRKKLSNQRNFSPLVFFFWFLLSGGVDKVQDKTYFFETF